MPTIELISLSLNGLLAMALAALALRVRRLILGADARRCTTEAERDAARHGAECVRHEYLRTAQGVADAVREVRQDIDRNYRHMHECDLLD